MSLLLQARMLWVDIYIRLLLPMNPVCHFALSFSHLSSLQKPLLAGPQRYNHISCFYRIRVIHTPSLLLYLQNIFLDRIGWPLRTHALC